MLRILPGIGKKKKVKKIQLSPTIIVLSQPIIHMMEPYDQGNNLKQSEFSSSSTFNSKSSSTRNIREQSTTLELASRQIKNLT